ncbi:hypothetical protein [Roseivirga pacifica]|uniref:hypothetical protein n=1 Tax=Roseivirga pacifica TaxID=1267423 RepID=UPI003BA88D0A
MKVFISWSGNKSHKVALVFRDWLPSVIQSIEPYVSSEDIDKGARWSTDIATELADSTYGILCVTKENLNASWLSFEAGALSKTMEKSYVSPFLFDIKRSEVDGPILQFQSTIFQKDDIKKLVKSLNKACEENSITDTRLEKAFDVWYPTLEEELNKLKDVKDEEPTEEIETTGYTSEILEEILDLSRNNQKLLRNPDPKLIETIETINKNIQEQRNYLRHNPDSDFRRISRKFHPVMIEELMHLMPSSKTNHYGFLIALSFFKKDFPWIYDAGKELVDVLKSKSNKANKHDAISEFRQLMEFTLEHPVMREIYGMRGEYRMYMKEIPHMMMRYIDRLQE